MILNWDYLRAGWIIRKNSRSFYKAFSVLKDPHQRNAIYTVYAFCRYADDYIDKKNDLSGLERLENDLKSFEQGRIPNHFLWRAMKDVFKRYPLSTKPFFDMIKGQRMDLVKTRYSDVKELLDYCYHVASSVGYMILPILAPENHKELGNYALYLGYALQITNILRDVGEDWKMGRVYIPRSLMDKHGYTEADLQNHIIDSRFIALWEELAADAEKYYSLADKDLGLFPADSRLAVALSSRLYHAILEQCRKEGHDVFSHRPFITDETKNRIILELRELVK